MPQPFLRFHARDGSVHPLDTFPDTNVSDPSFDLVEQATFIVFNRELGLDVLGEEPRLESISRVSAGTVRDAATYVPCINAIILSSFEQETIPQHIIDLSRDPPTIEDYVSDPPVYAVNGGRYFNKTVYWAVSGGFPFTSPTTGREVFQSPGIVALDPFTNKTTTLLNNYYGARFNGPDDLQVASNGDIFFTDAYYAWAENVTSNPIAPPGTWRFQPSTGRTQIVESSLVQPNGIAISPDEKTMYIGDSGLTVFNTPNNVIPRFSVNSTGPRFLYAYDITDSPGGKYLVNKRVLYMAHEFGIDGVQVAGNGYIVGATGTSVDILTPDGELLVQVRLSYVVNNVMFVKDDMWILGLGGISRVRWNLRGPSVE